MKRDKGTFDFPGPASEIMKRSRHREYLHFSEANSESQVSYCLENLLKSFQRSKQVVDKHFISTLSVQRFRSYYDPMGKKTVSVFSKTYVGKASHEKEWTQIAKKCQLSILIFLLKIEKFRTMISMLWETNFLLMSISFYLNRFVPWPGSKPLAWEI